MAGRKFSKVLNGILGFGKMELKCRHEGIEACRHEENEPGPFELRPFESQFPFRPEFWYFC